MDQAAKAKSKKPTAAKIPRSERRRTVECRPIIHVVAPGMEVARADIRSRESVAAFLKRSGWATKDKKYGWQFRKGLPTILEINGEAVLRKAWRTTRVEAGDYVRFVSYPLGGKGAKQVIGLVALVAVAAFAMWAPVGLFGMTAGSFGATALSGAIGVGGSLFINALGGKKHVGNKCSDPEVGSASDDGRCSVSDGWHGQDDRAESESDAASVLRRGVPWPGDGASNLRRIDRSRRAIIRRT